jgi:hypothetical protein
MLVNSTLIEGLYNTTEVIAAVALGNAAGNGSSATEECGSVDAFGATSVINTTYFIGG